MAQLVADSFDGVADTDLLTHNPNWAALSGATGTTSIDATGTRLRQTSTSTGTTHFYRTDAVPASADYSVSADVYVSNNTGTGATGVVGRSSTTVSTFYQARVLNGTGVQLLRVIAGTATTLGTLAMTLTNSQIVALKLEMTGSTINVYVNGSVTPDISATDAGITDIGYPGVRFLNLSSGQLRLDNFSADEAGGASNATGTFASTLADASMSAAGQLTHAGSFNSSLSGAAMSSSGTVAGSPSGSFASSLSDATMTASGSQLNAGAYAATMQGATMSATGNVAQFATGSLASSMVGASMAAYGAIGDDEPPDGVVLNRYRWRVLRRHFTN